MQLLPTSRQRNRAIGTFTRRHQTLSRHTPNTMDQRTRSIQSFQSVTWSGWQLSTVVLLRQPYARLRPHRCLQRWHRRLSFPTGRGHDRIPNWILIQSPPQYPIGFLSKALHGAELQWSTFEQECWAIHQTIKKFSYLLRDVKFTIKTDHRNLLYLNNEASPKVLRWKWDIQQYNFDVLHIAGEHNVAADLFSRLCGIHPTASTTENYQAHIDSLTDIELEEAIEAAQDSISRGSSASFLLAIAATRRVGPLRPWMKDNRPIDQEVHKKSGG